MKAPKCRFCGTEHWSGEPHARAVAASVPTQAAQAVGKWMVANGFDVAEGESLSILLDRLETHIKQFRAEIAEFRAKQEQARAATAARVRRSRERMRS